MSFDPNSENPNTDRFDDDSSDSDRTEEYPIAEIVEPAEENQVPPMLTNVEHANSISNTQAMGRLHPTSLVFDLISHVRSLVVPLLLGVFGVAKGNFGYLVIAAIFFVPTVAFSIIRYMSLQYRIQNGELVVTKGIFFRRVRTVPLERIQNIDLVQSLFHRMFNVAEVRVETASGTEPEATLRVLSLDDVERLRSIVFESGRETGQTATGKSPIGNSPIGKSPIGKSLAGDSIEHSIGAEPGADAGLAASTSNSSNAAETILSIPVFTLIKAGLASNRGSVLIGVLAGLYFQFDLEKYFDLKEIEKWIPKGLSTFQQVLYAIVGATVLLLCLRIFGIVWYLLRFYGYQLTRKGNDLRISCGLFTKVSATVPRNRIQFISIHRNIFMRWMKLATIRIETAGGASKQGQDATKSVSSRWFIPAMSEADVPAIIEQLRPGQAWDEQQFDWQPLSPRAGKRMLRIGVVLSVLMGLVGFAVTQPWGWVAGVVALPFFLWHAIKKSRAMRYARTNDGIVYRSGVLTHKTSVTFYEKIQTLEVSQSPFDKRWGMATLTVDTAGAGPADHQIDIRYLTQEFANAEYDQLVVKAASHQPVFG